MVQLFSFSLPAVQHRPLPEPSRQQHAPHHLPLEQVVRPMLTTAEAAFYLNLKPQTLRIWACKECGPIRPVRLHGRLGWPLADIRRYLHVDPPSTLVPAH